MHRSELPTDFPVFEKILISSWVILQLTTGILGLLVLTEPAPSPHTADRPSQYHVKQLQQVKQLPVNRSHQTKDASPTALMADVIQFDRWQRLPAHFYLRSR